MTDTTTSTDADKALKAKHRAMWAQGNYADIAANDVGSLGVTLVDALGITKGQHVLDIAAGTGNAAIPAAQRGADVTASDLTPELLDIGRHLAQKRGVDLDWRVADAEALPFASASFDVVMSCLGVMFAPHHQLTANELARVCRSGGSIGLINWTPEGFVGQMFATMKTYAPPPPPGAQPPPLWGNEDHVRSLLDGQVTDLRAERRVVRVDRFGSPEEFVDYFKSNYGPTMSVFASLGGDADRVAALHDDLTALVTRFTTGSGTGSGSMSMDWEYLLVTARRN